MSNRTHRSRLARLVAAQLGLTYTAALRHVEAAARAGALPHSLADLDSAVASVLHHVRAPTEILPEVSLGDATGALLGHSRGMPVRVDLSTLVGQNLPAGVALVGAPGSGKSILAQVLLQHAATVMPVVALEPNSGLYSRSPRRAIWAQPHSGWTPPPEQSSDPDLPTSPRPDSVLTKQTVFSRAERPGESLVSPFTPADAREAAALSVELCGLLAPQLFSRLEGLTYHQKFVEAFQAGETTFVGACRSAFPHEIFQEVHVMLLAFAWPLESALEMFFGVPKGLSVGVHHWMFQDLTFPSADVRPAAWSNSERAAASVHALAIRSAHGALTSGGMLLVDSADHLLVDDHARHGLSELMRSARSERIFPVLTSQGSPANVSVLASMTSHCFLFRTSGAAYAQEILESWWGFSTPELVQTLHALPSGHALYRDAQGRTGVVEVALP